MKQAWTRKFNGNHDFKKDTGFSNCLVSHTKTRPWCPLILKRSHVSTRLMAKNKDLKVQLCELFFCHRLFFVIAFLGTATFLASVIVLLIINYIYWWETIRILSNSKTVFHVSLYIYSTTKLLLPAAEGYAGNITIVLNATHRPFAQSVNETFSKPGRQWQERKNSETQWDAL